MFCIYILRSLKNPTKTYIGFSLNPEKRLIAHNAGQSSHTNKFKPWKIIFSAAFEKEQTARNFEKYLKTASGIAFRHKRLT
jgi:putative endonuclease